MDHEARPDRAAPIVARAKSTRDVALEALRGLASASVLLWHVMLGFFPERSGEFADLDASKAIDTSPWFGFIYGTASVSFFFVLSGFVLTRHLFVTGDPTQIYRNAIKRWPRLAAPVLVTVLASWIVFKLHLYFFEEGAALTRSPWLAKFGLAYDEPFQVHLFDAFRQGAFRTFFRGDFYYDSSLWTMRFEFIGSMVAFGLALLVQPIPGTALRAYLIAVALGLCHYIDPFYAAFVVGVALAAALPPEKRRVSLPLTLATIAVAMYLAGFSGVREGAFRPLGWFVPHSVSHVYVNIVGAAALLVAVESSPAVHAALSAPWAVWLGRLSFPLYLVHVPVLCSLGCAVLLELAPRYASPAPQIAAALATMGVSVAVAYPLVRANEWWTRRLNRLVARVDLPR